MKVVMPGVGGSHAPALEAPGLIRTNSQVRAKSRPTAGALSRNEVVDVIRLIAAGGIVYVHAARSPALDASRNLFRFAVPFYLFASLYFQSLSMRRKPDRTLAQFTAGRFVRLYFPFLAWSVIYLLARDLKRSALLHVGSVELTPGLLWKGVEYHLWFLPFLLAASILLAVIHWLFLRQNRFLRWPLILIAIAAGFWFCLAPMPSSWDEVFDNPTYAYVQYWRAMPAMCWGMAFAWFMTMGPGVYEVSQTMGVAGIVLAAGCSIMQVFRGIGQIPRGLSGFGCMLAALAPWQGRFVPVLARFGRYSYGIYLSHVLVGEMVRAAMAHTHLSASVGLDLVIFGLSFIGSLAIVMVLGKSPQLAWLNGC